MDCSLRMIVDALRHAKDHHRSCSVLLGAGCSATAGIPLASGFVEEIKNRWGGLYDRAPVKDYPHCMAQLPDGDRRDLILEYVEKAKLNWAHLALATIIDAGYVDRILTTNFDPLAMRACAMMDIFPAVYDFAASKEFRSADVLDRAIYHLHGQHSGFVLLNTKEAMEQHTETLAPVFEDSSGGRVWIVVGYSGENDPVFNLLARVKRFNHGLFWVGYEDSEPPRHVREHLLQDGKYASYLKGFDADRFFIALAQELDCFPPSFVQRPFTSLGERMDRLQPLDMKGFDEHRDFLKSARERIAQAAATLEVREPVPEDDCTFHELEPEIQSSNAEALLLAGKYDVLAGMADNLSRPSDDPIAEFVAWSLITQGTELYDRAGQTQGDEGVALFVEANRKYEQALAIKPDMHEALNNWGIALAEQAERTEGDEGMAFFVEACRKYEEAVAIKPDMHKALNNWGVALADQAKRTEGDEGVALLVEACRKYEEALAIKPDKHETLNNWGVALADQAKRTEGDEGVALFVEANRKYEEALAIKPDKHETLNNWGVALADQAKRTEGDEGVALLVEACQKCEEALAIKPDLHDALNNWGVVLADQAKRTEGDEGVALLVEACRKYEEALAIKPDLHDALNNWGVVLADQAKRTDGDEGVALFVEAFRKYEEAIAIKPDKHGTLNNWGNALLTLATRHDGKKRDVLWGQAEEKLLEVESIEMGTASYNLACLASLRRDPEECREWLENSHRYGDLPSVAHLDEDTDLDNVREESWYGAFIEKVRSGGD